MAMTTSAEGRAALIAREGCRLTAYKDTAGIWTIGVGHTGRASGLPVRPGTTITRDEAEALFCTDLRPFEAVVNEAVTVPMTQHQFDACVSLAFNIGAGGFAGSTVAHQLNLGRPQAAADAFLLWHRPPELLARRKAERQQFRTGDAPSAERSPSAPAIPPVVAPPHILPKPQPGAWARLWAQLTGKAA